MNAAERLSKNTPLLKVSDLCEMLSLSRSKVYTLIREDKLKSFTIDGARRIHQRDLDEFLEKHRTAATT